MKVPCEECPTMSICRSRDYHHLLNMCERLETYLELDNPKLHKKRMKKFVKILKPKYWSLSNENEQGFTIFRVNGWSDEVTV